MPLSKGLSFRSKPRKSWGAWILGMVLLILVLARLSISGYLPNTAATLWRASEFPGLFFQDPAQGLAPPDLAPYIAWNWVLLHLPFSPWGMVKITSLGIWGGILWGSWCYGHLWAAGLWGLSPWILSLSLEPNSQLLGALFLAWGMVAQYPWIYWGLACSVSLYTWPLALLFSLFWPRAKGTPERQWGILSLWIVMVITLIWSGGLHWTLFQGTQGLMLTWISPLMLTVGLVFVRVLWPWQQRKQAGMSLLVLGYLCGALGLLQVQGSLSLDPVIRMSLIVWPLLCHIASGVLTEIPILWWRRCLGILLLGSSFLLTLQELHHLPQRLVPQDPIQAASQWLQDHLDPSLIKNQTILVDSPTLAVVSHLPTQQIFSSRTLESLYRDPLPNTVHWILLNTGEPGVDSALLSLYPEFGYAESVPGWILMYREPSLPLSFQLESEIAPIGSRTSIRIWERWQPDVTQMP